MIRKMLKKAGTLYDTGPVERGQGGEPGLGEKLNHRGHGGTQRGDKEPKPITTTGTKAH
jgi:hypothetical protein